MTYVKAVTVGLMVAIVAQIVFTVCEFAVKYAFVVARNGGVGGIGGVAVQIPSLLSVVAAVAGFAYGYRWILNRAQPHAAR